MLKSKMNKKLNARRILIVRTDRIGDVLLSTPVVKALRDAYPQSYMAIMVRPYAEDIARANPLLDEVIVYDKYGCHKSFFLSLKFAIALRKKNFDLAVVLHPTNRVHLITWLAAIRVRLGFNKKLGFLLTNAVMNKKHLGLKHEVDYGIELLEEIGIYSKERLPFMKVKEADLNWVSAFFREKKIDRQRPVFCLHPGASCISKKWPVENFAKLNDRLYEEFKGQVIVFAGSREEAIARSVYSLSRHKPACVLEGVPLSKIAALIKESNLLISNDSGPVHISVAVRTPVIAIFGRSQPGLSPKRWGPLGEKDIVLHKNVNCEVCMAHSCLKQFKCLRAIKVEDVLDGVRKIFQDISC